jgi:putative intracellular protease/amidase/YHS domain-containing protein
MNRRQLLHCSAAFSAIGLSGGPFAFGKEHNTHAASDPTANTNPLTPPENGSIPVAFLISQGAVLIDFVGPWEVFREVSIPGRSSPIFSLFTVAETSTPVRASGGMQVTPDYTIATSPAPKILVIPAQSAAAPAVKDWIKKVTETTDVTMSVCNGAFVLASTGLLSGRPATAYHGSYSDLQHAFPDVDVKRGMRFVETGNIATSGGLSSGIDLAIRVVERYFGRAVAKQTAFTLEYQGEGWMHPESNAVYASMPAGTARDPICPVCGMAADRTIQSIYKGKTYYFCDNMCKSTFERSSSDFARS